MADRRKVTELVAEIEVAYPIAFQNTPTAKIQAMINLWSKMFADVDNRTLEFAVKSFIANNTRGIPPTIGQINEIIWHSQESSITEIEAWQMIKKAMRESYDYESAKREWEKLPPEVRAPIRPADLREWGSMESDLVNSTISAAYRRSFLAKQKREEERRALPAAVRNLLPVRQIE